MAAQSPEEGTVQVVVRVRPFLEADRAIRTVVEVDQQENCVRIDGSGTYYCKERIFSLHRVFGPDTLQCDIFDACVSPLIDDVLLGYNVCVFAYGQTGSGKTYTMEGPVTFAPESRRSSTTTTPKRRATVAGVETNGDVNVKKEVNVTPVRRRASTQALFSTPPSRKQTQNGNAELSTTVSVCDSESRQDVTLTEEHGFVQRSVFALFDRLEMRHQGCHEVSVSHLEIYNEELHDLMADEYMLESDKQGVRTVFGSVLSRSNGGLRLEEDTQARIRCAGLTERSVLTAKDALALVRRSCQARTKRATLLNEHSSRSHSIMSLNVCVKNGIDERGMNVERYAQLRLVDLAGSESAKRSDTQGSMVRESTTINQSLLTLGRVIVALVNKLPHIPYRDSKLTRLLQDSLGGSAKTLIVSTVSALKSNMDETVSTLQYAVNAARITNAPKRNMRTSINARIKGLIDDNARLRELLKATQDQNGEIVPKGMLQTMEKELADLREHVGTLNQRLAISDERSRTLSERLSEKDHELEERAEQSRVKDCEMDALRDELESEQKQAAETTDLRREEFRIELDRREKMIDQRIEVLKAELDRKNENQEVSMRAMEVVEEEREELRSQGLAKDRQVQVLRTELKDKSLAVNELNEKIDVASRDKSILTSHSDDLRKREKLLCEEMQTGQKESHTREEFLQQELLAASEKYAEDMQTERKESQQREEHMQHELRVASERYTEEMQTEQEESQQREESWQHELRAASERYTEERSVESRVQAELREESKAVGAALATLAGCETEEAALKQKCEQFAMYAEHEASLANRAQAELVAKSQAVERESRDLERLVSSAVAGFSQRLSNRSSPAG